MSKNKKTFKDNTAHLDRFFTTSEDSRTHAADKPHDTQKTHQTHNTDRTHEPHHTHEPTPTPPKYYRLNLKLKIEYKEYLDNVSWENRKSITQYINDLIEADKANRDTRDIKNT